MLRRDVKEVMPHLPMCPAVLVADGLVLLLLPGSVTNLSNWLIGGGAAFFRLYVLLYLPLILIVALANE